MVMQLKKVEADLRFRPFNGQGFSEPERIGSTFAISPGEAWALPIAIGPLSLLGQLEMDSSAFALCSYLDSPAQFLCQRIHFALHGFP